MPVTIDAIEDIRPFFEHSGSRCCDFTVGGLFMWIDLFEYEYCIYADTLFIKGLSEDDSGRIAFWLPIGKLSMAESVNLLRKYCAAENIPLLFTAVPDDRLHELTAVADCRISELPDWADYIYDAKALATLTGKAYNKKRNHVNRFEAENPGYKLEEIDESNVGDALRFFESLGIESQKSNPEMAKYEWHRCADVLRNPDIYRFEGAILRQPDGRVAAFTMGERRGDTLVLHIEKIEHLVAGAGETINKLFAAHMLAKHPEIKYINREDDAGDPGLRYAKESYHPLFLLRKYNALAI